MDTPIKKPPMSDEGRLKFATEVAFEIFANEAHNLGLPVRVKGGFESLGNAAVQLQWEAACRAVFEALRSMPQSAA